MVLLETKSALAKAGKFLADVMDASMQMEAEKAGTAKKTFEEMKKERELWSTEKVVSEFRKLFTDKTNFMNIYANTKVLSGSKIIQDNATNKEFTFKPTISEKAKKMDVNLVLCKAKFTSDLSIERPILETNNEGIQ